MKNKKTNRNKMDEQQVPNEILSKIQKHADFETATNMSLSNAHLKSEWERDQRKKCFECMEYLFSFYLLNDCICLNQHPTLYTRKKYTLPTISMYQMITKYSQMFYNMFEELVQRTKEMFKHENYDVHSEITKFYELEYNLYCDILDLLPFEFDINEKIYLDMCCNFLLGKDYRHLGVLA